MCTASVHTRVGFCLVGVLALLFAAPRGSAAPQESGRAFRLEEGAAIKKQTRRPQPRALASHRSLSRTFGPLDREGEVGSDPFRSPPRAPRHARPPPVNTPLRSGERSFCTKGPQTIMLHGIKITGHSIQTFHTAGPGRVVMQDDRHFREVRRSYECNSIAMSRGGFPDLCLAPGHRPPWPRNMLCGNWLHMTLTTSRLLCHLTGPCPFRPT